MKIKNLDGNIIEHVGEEEDIVEDDEKMYLVSFSLQIEVVAVPSVEIVDHPEAYLFEYSEDMPESFGTLDVDGIIRIKAYDDKEAIEIVRDIVDDEESWDISGGNVQGIDIIYIDAEVE